MSFMFNGIRKSWITVTKVRRPYQTNRVLNISRVPGMPGGHLVNVDEEPLVIPVRIEVSGENRDDYFDKAEELVDWLSVIEPAPLIFDDRLNRIYYALVQGSLDPEEIVQIGYINILFVCPNPYKYGPEVTVSLNTDTGSTINVEGTAEAKPIFELDVLAPITFAMVSNGEEYMLIGQPTTVDEQIVDAKTLLFEEDGSSIGTWLTATPEMEGGSQGTIGYDGAGITAPSYGSGNYFHGPSVYKEVPVTGDFEIELRGQLLTDNVQQTGRIGFFLFDDQMREIAFMAAADNSIYVPRKLAEGRIGPFIGDFKNYLVSSRNYQWEWDNFPALLRLRRVGDRYEFYVARVLGNGSHMNPLAEPWTVFEDKFRGALKYVGIFIDKHGDTPSPHTARIDYIKAYQLNQLTVDQTPYIADVGDKISFNHKTKELLLNGEPVKKGELGASPFKLKPGENNIVLLPENGLQGVMKYNPAYK